MPPSFGCLKCEALCKPFVGLLLSVPPTLVSLTLSVHFPLSDPPLFVCGLQSGMQNLSQVGSPLLSTIVSPVSLSLSWRAWFSMPWFLHLKNELNCSTHLTGIELMYIKCLEQGLVPHEHWLSVSVVIPPPPHAPCTGLVPLIPCTSAHVVNTTLHAGPSFHLSTAYSSVRPSFRVLKLFRNLSVIGVLLFSYPS